MVKYNAEVKKVDEGTIHMDRYRMDTGERMDTIYAYKVMGNSITKIERMKNKVDQIFYPSKGWSIALAILRYGKNNDLDDIKITVTDNEKSHVLQKISAPIEELINGRPMHEDEQERQRYWDESKWHVDMSMIDVPKKTTLLDFGFEEEVTT